MNTKVLQEALDHNLNVLLEGVHGTGKTMTVKELFTKKYGPLHQKWLYFSAATMDPWVDFIGVPKQMVDENNQPYLELIRPKYFLGDQIEAIFFDELNRSHKKVRNAIMELLQFGSINGRPLPNLKVIWAAINPDDDEELSYDVEKLDPAQLDRFQIKIKVPNVPNLNYFKTTYGSTGVNAVKWYQKLNSNTKKILSPRRLEYAVQAVRGGYSVSHILYDPQINTSEFLSYVQNGDPVETLKDLSNASETEIKDFFADHNNLQGVMKFINANQSFADKFCKFIPQEELLKYLNKSTVKAIGKSIIKNLDDYSDIVTTISTSPKGYNKNIIDAINRYHINKTIANNFPNGKINILGTDHHISQLKIVITGTHPNFKRDDIRDRLVAMGIACYSNMSQSVTHLLVGANAKRTSKYKYAERNSIPMISIDDFLNIINGSNKTANASANLDYSYQEFKAVLDNLGAL